MNKKLAAFYADRGLTVSGNRAYGILGGYEVNAEVVGVGFNYSSNMPFRLNFSFYATDEQRRNMETEIRSAGLVRCKCMFTQYGLSAEMSDFTIGKFVDRLPGIIDTLTGIISQNGGLAAEYCPVCGNAFADNKKECSVDGRRICLDADCVEKLNAVIDAENKEFDRAPNNYLRGFLGALIGGVAGAAVAVLLYFAGFYSSLSAIVSLVVGTFLYRKLGGKPNKIMIVIVAATTVVCMVLSVFLIYLIAAGVAAHNEGLSISAMEAFKIVMQDSEVSRQFGIDMAMILLFSVIGIVLQVVGMSQMVKRKKAIK